MSEKLGKWAVGVWVKSRVPKSRRLVWVFQRGSKKYPATGIYVAEYGESIPARFTREVEGRLIARLTGCRGDGVVEGEADWIVACANFCRGLPISWLTNREAKLIPSTGLVGEGMQWTGPLADIERLQGLLPVATASSATA